MVTRNNTTAFIKGAVAIAFLLYLPFWFNKRFPPTPKADEWKLGEEAGIAEQDSATVDRSTEDLIEQPKEPAVDDDLGETNRETTEPDAKQPS